MLLKAIVLDFDGVIVESNKIKHQAFSKLFSSFPEKYDEIISYHLAHNAVNRHDKFRYIMESILEWKYDKKLAEKWAIEFSELTRNDIINCPYVKGALEFITVFSKKYPIYLASATPLDELTVILKGRDILHFFKGIYGAPTPKLEVFQDIVKKERIKPENMLYIGDSPEDNEVAKEFGCFFIAKISEYDFEGMNVKSFKNMFEIKTYILNYLMGDGVEDGLPNKTVSA